MTTVMKEPGSELPRYLRRICEVMESLPAGVTPRMIADRLNINVTTYDMNRLIALKVVERVERTEPPLVGYRLLDGWRFKLGDKLPAHLARRYPQTVVAEAVRDTPSGRRADVSVVARRLRLTIESTRKLLDYYGLWVPNRATPARTAASTTPASSDDLASLKARVSREELQAVLNAKYKSESLSLGEIAAVFQTTPALIRALIGHYDLWHQPAAETEAPAGGGEQSATPDRPARRRTRLKGDEDQALISLLISGRGSTRGDRRKLAAEFGIALKSVDLRYYRMVKDGTIRRQEPSTPVDESRSAAGPDNIAMDGDRAKQQPLREGMRTDETVQSQSRSAEDLAVMLAGGGLCALCAYLRICRYSKVLDQAEALPTGAVTYGPTPVLSCSHYSPGKPAITA